MGLTRYEESNKRDQEGRDEINQTFRMCTRKACACKGSRVPVSFVPIARPMHRTFHTWACV